MAIKKVVAVKPYKRPKPGKLWKEVIPVRRYKRTHKH